MSTQRNILDRYLIHATQAFYPKPAINKSCHWRPCGRLIRNISICKSLINYTGSDAVNWQGEGNTKPTKLSDYLTTILTVLSGRIQMLMTGTMLSVGVDWSREVVGQPFPPAVLLLSTSLPQSSSLLYQWSLSSSLHDDYLQGDGSRVSGTTRSSLRGRSARTPRYISLCICISHFVAFLFHLWLFQVETDILLYFHFLPCCRWLCSCGREVGCARIVWRPTWRAQWPALRAASTAAALQALQPAPTTPLPPLLP